MKFKSLIIMLGFIVIGFIANCQISIQFTYDDSGNRIERKVIDLSKSAIIAKSSASGWEEALIDQLSNLEIKIYPNPTKGKIKIEIPALEKEINGAIQIFDINGRIIINQQYIKPRNIVNIEHVKNGFYFLKLQYEGQLLEWKIIKQ